MLRIYSTPIVTIDISSSGLAVHQVTHSLYVTSISPHWSLPREQMTMEEASISP